MGKKQHQKDKLYLTAKEWRNQFGGHKDTSDTRIQKAVFKRLPFSHCALTFLPFKEPVCSPDGVIFEKKAILAQLKKQCINPVDGKRLRPSQLIDLHFNKDTNGNFQCPVTYRTFSQNSVIVVISTTGNVYSMEAIEELNLKRNHLKDLLTDVPFLRKDIITLQDPNNIEKFNIESFYHVRTNNRTLEEIAKEKREMESPGYFLNKVQGEAKEAIEKLNFKYVAKKAEQCKGPVADSINAAHYSQGRMAAGLTSTVMEPITFNQAAILDDDSIKYSRVTKNGYVQMLTNHGPLNLELFCKIAPKACENFIVHCREGYYNNSKFHRLIKNFVLQGGDPTGTGKEGESIWGKPFEDEINGAHKHDQRGLLSMANKGSNTNQSQFFITFRSAKHLDGKHTIFGRLVGGAQTLDSIENVPTDDETDVPLEPVIFINAQVFVDPFEEATAQIAKDRLELKGKTEKDHELMSKQKSDDNNQTLPKLKAYSSGVGKYIKPDIKSALKRVADKGLLQTSEPKRSIISKPFSNFDDW